jgi:molybdopterin molybdotransferase
MTFRGSPFAFESPARAIEALCTELVDGPAMHERVSLQDAVGRFLAENVALDRDSPAFDNAMMDGYAVRASDLPTAGSFRMRVVAEARIGKTPPDAAVGAAIRIATGAPMPAGCDLVLPRERVRELPDGMAVQWIEGSVDATHAPQAGDHVRRRGENAKAGSIVLRRGECLSMASIGTLASAGCHAPTVRARMRVAIMTTGEELVAASDAPGPYAIRDSNGPALMAALVARRWISASPAVREPGDAGTLAARLVELAATHDAILICGGVSMGHRDPVRTALESVQARIIFHGLPQRPGKPVLGATLSQAGRRMPVLALPGNPLSALVCCERLVIPVLAHFAGGRLPQPPAVMLERVDGRTLPVWWHRLVRIGADGRAHLVDLQGSGDVPAGGRADGFIELPPGESGTAGCWPFHAWPT